MDRQVHQKTAARRRPSQIFKKVIEPSAAATGSRTADLAMSGVFVVMIALPLLGMASASINRLCSMKTESSPLGPTCRGISPHSRVSPNASRIISTTSSVFANG